MKETKKYDNWMVFLSISVIVIIVCVFILTVTNTRLLKGTYSASDISCPSGYVSAKEENNLCCPSSYPNYDPAGYCCPPGYPKKTDNLHMEGVSGTVCVNNYWYTLRTGYVSGTTIYCDYSESEMPEPKCNEVNGKWKPKETYACKVPCGTTLIKTPVQVGNCFVNDTTHRLKWYINATYEGYSIYAKNVFKDKCTDGECQPGYHENSNGYCVADDYKCYKCAYQKSECQGQRAYSYNWLMSSLKGKYCEATTFNETECKAKEDECPGSSSGDSSTSPCLTLNECQKIIDEKVICPYGESCVERSSGSNCYKVKCNEKPDTPTSNSGSNPTSNTGSNPTSNSGSNPTSNTGSNPTSNPGSNANPQPTEAPTQGTTVNPQTGTAGIIVAWVIGLAAIIYSLWYYKKSSSI